MLLFLLAESNSFAAGMRRRQLCCWSDVFTKLAEDARRKAYDLMVDHAAELGSNAMIGARFDANEIADGITEVLAYGTAVRVEPIRSPDCLPKRGGEALFRVWKVPEASHSR